MGKRSREEQSDATDRVVKKIKKAVLPSKKSSIKAQVQKILKQNLEQKYFDISVTAQAVDYSGVINDISAVTQGSGDSNRVGDKIMPHYLSIKGSVVVGDATNAVRVFLIRYKENTNTGGPPTMSILLGGPATSTNSPFSQYYWDGRESFDVLKSELFVLDTTNSIQKFEWFVPLDKANKAIEYVSAGTNGRNRFYLCQISDSGAAPNPTTAYVSRLVYYDA